MKQFILSISLSIALLFHAEKASSDYFQGIAAIVNDEIISLYDLEERMRLVISSVGMQDNIESRDDIRSATMQSLIDETLQIQEAQQFGISVSESEIDDALREIEKLNKIPENEIESFLETRGINMEYLRKQIRGKIAWSKIMQQYLIPQIEIKEEEVKEWLMEYQKNIGNYEFLVSEIFLGTSSSTLKKQTEKNAKKILEYLKKDKSFVNIAKQFSESPQGKSGGDLGWVQEGHLISEIDENLKEMKEGEIRLTQSLSGYHILYLRKKRIVGKSGREDFYLKQILIKNYSLTQETANLDKTQKELAKKYTSCESIKSRSEGIYEFNDLGTLSFSDMPEKLKKVVVNLRPQELSKPIKTDYGIMFLMVCNKIQPKVEMPSEEEIRNKIRSKRLSLSAQKFIRDLRNKAEIDLRISL